MAYLIGGSSDDYFPSVGSCNFLEASQDGSACNCIDDTLIYDYEANTCVGT